MASSLSVISVAAEASGVGTILEKDLIEPGQMRARLESCLHLDAF